MGAQKVFSNYVKNEGVLRKSFLIFHMKSSFKLLYTKMHISGNDATTDEKESLLYIPTYE